MSNGNTSEQRRALSEKAKRWWADPVNRLSRSEEHNQHIAEAVGAFWQAGFQERVLSKVDRSGGPDARHGNTSCEPYMVGIRLAPEVMNEPEP